MSKYAFAIKDAAAMLVKAKHDSDRFNQKGNDRIAATYAAIDYMQTAWHLADWIAKETGKTKTVVRDEIDPLCGGMFKLAGDLANGQKHWYRSGNNPPQVVEKTSAPPVKRRLSPMGVAIAYNEPIFAIHKDGRKIYAQILIRDTLQAIESYMLSAGLIPPP